MKANSREVQKNAVLIQSNSALAPRSQHKQTEIYNIIETVTVSLSLCC